jgi:nucleoside recognition membrane protein YjiH
VNGVIQASVAISGLFTAFVVSYWKMKAFGLKEAVVPAGVEQSRYKKAA